ncbi:MAG: quinolinate synthase NadA [Bacteroidales bacterium]
MPDNDIIKKIDAARKASNATILAHYYQIPEIQDIADHVGDSFALSRLATEVPADVIVFCGVDFMAESAKILSPQKKVLLPVKDAGCPMADMATAEEARHLKQQYPEAALVSYVNSTTEVKAESDLCCTSANAVNVIRTLPNKQIIFMPDKNLGAYAAYHIPEKEFILFDGYCPPHEEVMAIDVKLARDNHPDATLLVHPECRPEVREAADFIGSTSQIIKHAGESDHQSFIIGTEEGILHPLQKQYPDKTFYMLTDHFSCYNMKKTNLQHLLQSLETGKHEVEIDDDLMDRARKPLMRMLNP